MAYFVIISNTWLQNNNAHGNHDHMDSYSMIKWQKSILKQDQLVNKYILKGNKHTGCMLIKFT